MYPWLRTKLPRLKSIMNHPNRSVPANYPLGNLNWKTRLLILGALVGIGIASRFLLMDWPNFKPIGALALVCGFLFSGRWQVLVAVTVMLLVSDALIGFYEWQLMVSVYASILIACLAGMGMQTFLSRSSNVARFFGIAGTSLVASTVFFLLTNATVWLIGRYPAGLDGLLRSYAAGIPFFRNTIAGDLCFSLLFFSAYFAIRYTVVGSVAKRSASGVKA